MSRARIEKRARGILSRELRAKTGEPGQLRLRFLDGVTPDGCIFFAQTVHQMADKVYELHDNYHLAAPMLTLIRDTALQKGYIVYACPCPRTPERLLHVIIPQLSLAFVTTDATRTLSHTPFRRVRLDAYAAPEQLRPLRGKLRLLARLSASLIDDAVAEIAAAHLLHDDIEDLYRPHLDIAALEQTTTQTIALLQSLH